MMKDDTEVALQSCSDFEFYLDDYLEESLTTDEKLQFETHLNQCMDCQALLEDTKKIIALARKFASFPIPEDVSKRLHARLREEMQSSFRRG